MNEKYGIQLELLTESFNSKMNKAEKDAQKFGQVVEKSLTNKQIEIENAKFNQQIEQARLKVQNLQQELDEFETKGIQPSGFTDLYVEELIKAQQELTELTQKQEMFNASQLQMANSTKKVGDQSDKTASSFNKGMDKMYDRTRRLILSMFSVESVFALVSRASSTYLTHDLELAGKLEAVWAGIGAMLAPIIEYIANAVLKLVGYVNVFLEALTGINFIAKATEKSLNGVGDSASSASKNLAGFDEINNLSSSSSSGGIATDPFDYLNDVELNENVVNTLKDLADWLEKNWDWISMVGIALAATFGIATVGKWINNIGSLATSLGGGTGGLLSGLTSIATFGAIAVTIYIAGNIAKERQAMTEWMEDMRANSQQNLKEALDASTSVSDMYMTMATQAQAMREQSELGWLTQLFYGQEIEDNMNAQITKTSEYADKFGEILDAQEASVDEQYLMLQALDYQIEANQDLIDKLDKKGELEQSSLDSQYELKLATRDIVQGLVDQGIEWDQINEKTGIAMDDIISIYEQTGTPIPLEIRSNMSELQRFLYDLGQQEFKTGLTINVEYKGLDVGLAMGGIAHLFPSYDVGANYIPNDQLAMVHKGEAIIPAKYNHEKFIGNNNSSNEEVVYKLDELINVLENKDMNAYISSKEIGKASSNYIDSQTRIMGR